MPRRPALLSLCTGAAAVLLTAQLAGAQSVERVQLAGSARAAHRLPATLTVDLSSPTDYNRASATPTSGRWAGPRYESTRTPGEGGTSSIDWTVSFDEQSASPLAVAAAHVQHSNWQRDQREAFSVNHLVGKRIVGTVLGQYVLMTPGGGDGRFEAVLAFPLDTDLYAIVHLDLLEPPSDSDVVNGSILGSTWNRAQALIALAGVSLQGNLPPKIVSARANRRGTRVTGKVVDRFLGGVAAGSVSLQRGSGGGWRTVAQGRTSGRGSYSLPAGRRGMYRAVARIPGFSAESATFRAGRGR